MRRLAYGSARPTLERGERTRRFFADWTGSPETDDGAPARCCPARRTVSRLALVAATGGIVAGALLASGSSSHADPSAATWARLRMCESSGNYRTNTGNDHYGAYQFDLSTWRSVGGHGYPNLASPAEQDARALILYRERGWQPWQCAAILGLHEDADARSGRIADIRVPGATSPVNRRSHGPSRQSGVPAYPDDHSWFYGDSSATIRRFQDRMHRRGAIPPGTGQYGPLTKAVVVRLQQLNGINPSGTLGPLTWRAAWVGRWSPPPTNTKPRHRPAQSRPARVPAYPDRHSWLYGDHSRTILRFQDQMHRRGAIPPGTGYYGPLTRAVVVRLQRQNGITPSGTLGPLTWRAAWAGTYHG